MATVGINLVQSSYQNILQGNMLKADSATGNSVGFGSVLDQRIQTQTNKGHNKLPQKAEQAERIEKTDDSLVSSEHNVVANKTNKTDQSEMLKNQQASSDVEEEKVSEEELAAMLSQIQGACTELKQVLLDQLGMSEEELEQALEGLGMTMVDLFEPTHLTNFFLQMNGAEDASTLITDESLAANLQKLLEVVESMNPLKDMNLTTEDANEVIAMLKQYQREESNVNESQLPVVERTESTEEQFTTPVETSQLAPAQDNERSDAKKESSPSENHSQKSEETNEINLTVNASTDVTAETKVNFFEQLATTSQAKEIVEQIVREVKVTISPEQTSMEMVLTPETLGKVNLTVSAKNGVMTAHMVTETQAAKEAIESQLHVLKETFESQGVKVEAVEVTVAANQFDFMNQSNMNQRNQENQSKVKKSGGKLRMMDEFDEEEAMETSKETVNASIGKGTQIDINA